MQRTRVAGAVLVLAVSLAGGVARAEQKLGVEVYKKAELLPNETAFVKKASGVDAACYRTADRIEAVTAFYGKMTGFVTVQPNVLRRGQVDVALRPPQPNPRTGVVPRYAVFCIMQATP